MRRRAKSNEVLKAKADGQQVERDQQLASLLSVLGKPNAVSEDIPATMVRDQHQGR